MPELFKWLSSNPTATLVVISLFGILVVFAVLIYLVAFFQGREISFWPPKIGEKPEKSKTKKINSKGKKTDDYEDHQKPIYVYELGRMPIHEKVTFFENASNEVIEFGLSLSTFASFFVQRPAHEYKKPVKHLLSRGVNFKCLVLNPDSEIAAMYAKDRGEDGLVVKIQNSIKSLSQLRDEFHSYELSGSFEIYTYNHFPYCYILFVDPLEKAGRAYISHYMHGVKRADTPILEVHKSSNPILFEKYYKRVEEILKTSEKM